MVKNLTITDTIRLNGLYWFGHVQRVVKNTIPKKVLYMNLEMRLRGRPRNRWHDEVREDGRIVGGIGWAEREYNRKEWKKLLRTARNYRILHMPMERTNERMNLLFTDYEKDFIVNKEMFYLIFIIQIHY